MQKKKKLTYLHLTIPYTLYAITRPTLPFAQRKGQKRRNQKYGIRANEEKRMRKGLNDDRQQTEMTSHRQGPCKHHLDCETFIDVKYHIIFTATGLIIPAKKNGDVI